ncbi:MAG: hypothetical protein U0637_01255 [Phycisphaerales bacterium]
MTMRVAFGVGMTAVVAGAASGQISASSSFDGGPQGWTFGVAARWRATDGHPGGCVENFGEATNGPAWAIASPSFLGDWSSLNGHGTLRFDHKRVTNGGGSVLSFVPIIVEIIGPGGTARWESELLPSPGDWRTFEVPIARAQWQVASDAAWLAILSNVQTLRIFLEQVSNSAEPEDLNRLDNVSLGVRCDAIDFNGDGLYPDTADIDDFLSVFSGGPCSTGTCSDIDFNNDGLFPDTADIDSLLSVFSGGPCL